jgi:hypothetical protein
VSDYTEHQTFKAGDRVELHPAHDLWMRGARYGTVERTSSTGSVVWVRVDKASARLYWFHPQSLRHV